MTLLEQFDRYTVVSSVSKSTVALDREQIRRALAIAHAVEEMNDMTASHGWVVDDIMRRADELLNEVNSIDWEQGMRKFNAKLREGKK